MIAVPATLSKSLATKISRDNTESDMIHKISLHFAHLDKKTQQGHEKACCLYKLDIIDMIISYDMDNTWMVYIHIYVYI